MKKMVMKEILIGSVTPMTSTVAIYSKTWACIIKLFKAVISRSMSVTLTVVSYVVTRPGAYLQSDVP